MTNVTIIILYNIQKAYNNYNFYAYILTDVQTYTCTGEHAISGWGVMNICGDSKLVKYALYIS